MSGLLSNRAQNCLSMIAASLDCPRGWLPVVMSHWEYEEFVRWRGLGGTTYAEIVGWLERQGYVVGHLRVVL